MNTSQQESVLENFLSNPTEQKLSLLNDKEIALDFLEEEPESASKLYFLYTNGRIGKTKLDILLVAISEDNSEIIDKLYDLDYNKYEIRRIAEQLARYGKIDKLHDIYNRVNEHFDYLDLAYPAAEGGHMDIIKEIIEKNKVEPYEETNYSLIAKHAAIGGHKELMCELIEISDDGEDVDEEYWSLMAYGAAQGGHKDIFDFCLEQGANMYYWIAEGAAEGGNREILDFLIDKFEYGKDLYGKLGVWSKLANAAAKGGNREIVKDMIMRGACDFNEIALYAIEYNKNVDIVYDMLKPQINLDGSTVVGADDYDWIAALAANHNNVNLVYDMLKLGANQYYYIARHAGDNGHSNIVYDMVKRGADNYDELAISAIEWNDPILLFYLIGKGADNFDRMIRTAKREKCKDVINALETFGLET